MSGLKRIYHMFGLIRLYLNIDKLHRNNRDCEFDLIYYSSKAVLLWIVFVSYASCWCVLCCGVCFL